MQIKIELLEKEDVVLGFSDNKLAVKKKTGEVEIFILTIDENNLPRISEKSILITFGDGSTKKVSVTNKNSDIEVGTF